MEIIPKKKEKETSSVITIVQRIGLGFFVLSIIIPVILVILTWKTDQEVDEIRMEIDTKKSPEMILLEDEMRGHHQRVSDFAFILDKRISLNPMLEVIERNIHPNVYLSDIQIDTNERSIKTNGIAADIVAFDQQVKLFEEEEMILSLGIESFTRMDNGQISFPITITFNDQLFNLNN